MTQRFYSLTTIVLLVAVLIAVSYVPMAAADEWDKVLAAAKKEGTVSVIGPVGSDRHDTLTQSFEKKYGIKVDYLGDRGSGIGPKLTAERNAGKFLWDVFIGGTTTALSVTLPAGMLDPIEPALRMISPLARASKTCPSLANRTPAARPSSTMRRSTSTFFSRRRFARFKAGLRKPRADDHRRPRFWLTWK